MNIDTKQLAAIALSVAITVGFPDIGRGDDTDIYLNPSAPTGGEPLIMFVLDWRPSLGSSVSCDAGSFCDDLRDDGYLADGQAAGSGAATTFFDVLRAVLIKTLDPLGGVKIGFMLSHSNVNNCEGYPPGNKCSNGAYMLSGFKSMQTGSDDDDTWQTTGEDPDKVALAAKLWAIPQPQGNDSHPYQGKEVYFELFRYLTGQGVYNGHNGIVDFGDSTNDTVNLDVDRPAIAWDASIEAAAASGALDYISPLVGATSCTKIFVINLLFQVSQQEDDSDTAITATKANGGMYGINLSGNNNSFDTVIEYMSDVDLANGTFGTAPDIAGKQNVTSYFIVDSTKINQTTTGYANAGGTGVPMGLSEDPETLVGTLESVFKSILRVATTFVAPSVPINVFNRAQIVDQVFLALFEADENGLPFWPGNLKKLAINLNATTGVPELQDVNGNGAIDIDGRIKQGALTFWTDASQLPAPVDDEVAGADGRSVKRGGAGQKVTGFLSGLPQLSNSDLGARQLFTEDAADTTDGLRDLNGDATTATALWAALTADWPTPPSATTYAGATSAEKNQAINDLRWARGLTAIDINDTTSVRPWFLGDPLHSRPQPINYGAPGSYSAANQDIRILMGTTDGFMHMVRNTDTSGDHDGSETWAFAPTELLGGLDRLRLGQTGTPTHPIGLDGSPVTLRIDNDGDGTIETDNGDKVYAYFGLRRGGKSYYALDISTPDSPKFLAKTSKSDTDFGELGQTWSTPSLGRVDIGSGAIDVFVVGGGYNGDDGGDNAGDLGKDAANRNGTTGTDDDEGNAVFIINAQTGALVWKAVKGASLGYTAATKSYTHPGLLDSIPGQVAAVDSTGDRLLDRLYFADTGGVVWRADIAGADRSAWTLTKLFNAGRHFNSAASNDLRFFNRPDVVRTRDANGDYDAVIIGSGDREDPKETTVQNVFFMIKDNNVVSGTPPTTTLTPSDLADLTVDCISDSSCSSATLTSLDQNGWFMNLGASGSGEKNLSNALTLGGTVFFTDFRPAATGNSCDLSEGSGRQYAVDLQDARPVFNYDTANDGSGETLERYDELEAGGIPVEVVPIGDNYVLVQGQEGGANFQAVTTVTTWQTFWYER